MSALLFFVFFIIASLTDGQSCTPPAYQDLFVYPDKSLGLRYYSNINITATNTIYDAERAIIVIHGAALDADNYYCSMVETAQIEGYNVYNKDIIIIAPNFINSTTATKSEYYWPHTWRGCGNTDNPSNINEQISSCGAVDGILQYFQNNNDIYKNLVNITVVGHSAGGQFTDRYALTTILTNETYNLNIQYVIANPSSFTWLDSRRWFDGGIYRNLTLYEISSAPNYNTWEYGWSGTLPPYVINQGLTLDIAKDRFALRNVTYLQGTSDVCNHKLNSTCDDHDMDTSAAADFQGIFRLQRGFNFIRSLEIIYGKPIHRIDMVPFVGHDHVGMFESPNGRRAIF